MREKACVLNYIADAAAQTDGIPMGGGAAADDDLPQGGNEETIDQFQKRGFAAATAAEENEGLAGNDREPDVIDNRARITAAETIRNILELNGRGRVFCHAFRIHFD